ncbi:hypothetical protein [Brumimicrobium mesophilum]|uniref:hypothetical protein n=1 Tax=Brumimicrobium mesophilum TaxID=392717 RepID=UPI000D142C3E|nr:hypothetical protein [Brumimicrobium mesophilum]
MKKTVFPILTVLILGISISMNIQKLPSERKILKNISKSFGHVPSGEVNLDGNDKRISEFHISKTEVSNKEYQEFLHELKENGENEIYEVAKIDTLGWQKEFGQKSEAYSIHYHRHDGGKDIRNRSTKNYDGPSPMVGFRIVTTSIK